MTVGEKIKKFRTAKGLSQKQLGIMSSLSEPAIRNYELGNRQPDHKQIEKIASALEISPYALSDSDLDSYTGIMHSLFYLEEQYGIVPMEVDGLLVLSFKDKKMLSGTLGESIQMWQAELQKLQNGETTQEEYDLWRNTFPKMTSGRTMKSMRQGSAEVKNK